MKGFQFWAVAVMSALQSKEVPRGREFDVE
jgi:hypothetical protein